MEHASQVLQAFLRRRLTPQVEVSTSTRKERLSYMTLSELKPILKEHKKNNNLKFNISKMLKDDIVKKLIETNYTIPTSTILHSGSHPDKYNRTFYKQLLIITTIN